MSEKTYVVWVGGSEVNDYLLTRDNAKEMALEYKDKNYKGVYIENTKWIDTDPTNQYERV